MKLFETKHLDELVEDFSNYMKNTYALILSTFYIVFFYEHMENVNSPISKIFLIIAIGTALFSLFLNLPDVLTIGFSLIRDVFSVIPVILHRIITLLNNKTIAFFKREKYLADDGGVVNNVEVIEEEINKCKEIDQNILSNHYHYSDQQRKEFFSSIIFIKIIHFLNGLKLISPGFIFDSKNYTHHQNKKRKLFFSLIKDAFQIKIDSFRTRFNQDFYDSILIDEVVEKLKNIENFLIFDDQNTASYLEEFILIFQNNKLLKKSYLSEKQVFLLTLQLYQQNYEPKSPIVYFDKNDIDDLKIIRRYLIDFEKR